MNKFGKIAIAVAVTSAVALPATGALAASKTERALIGALIGGAAGAALGNGDGGAVAAGAAAGALVGVATAKPKYYRSGYRTSRPYYRDTRYGGYDRAYSPRDAYRYDTRYDDYGRRW